MNTTTEGQLVPQPGWWSRNWKWAVPSGCLGLLLSCGCLGALLFSATAWQSLRGTGVLVDAVTQAKQSLEVREALGEPIESSAIPQQYNMYTGNDGSSARFAVGVKGPKASGTLYGEGHKKDGEEAWTFTTLKVEIPDHPVINLLGPALEPAPETVPFDPKSLPDVEPLPENEEPAPRKPERGGSAQGQEDIQL
ncbi:cytochrome c oxidase assembly factor Coa1 family protein [Archangium violaceum]|uniref:cytochrome c oxidase assembly factor Coa1 family protein n=1 Tax=Archangium violaceum TaxID=83451 RepID=UPI000696563B|nr:cytochrome c oxidase assembly factor Coa1 family protein [Archangium violaceum]